MNGTMSAGCGAGMMAGMWLVSIPIVGLIAVVAYLVVRWVVQHEVERQLSLQNAESGSTTSAIAPRL